MNRTIDREDIFAAARASEFKRIEACCEGVPLKACSNDVWKGEIVAFVAELERRGGFGWQQAATWLCQHHHEFADMGALVKAMREAAPAAHSAGAQGLSDQQREALEWAADRFAQDAIKEPNPQDKHDFNESARVLRALLSKGE